MSDHDHISPYDRLAFSDVQVQGLLSSGEHAAELIALFGEPEYRFLRRLQAQVDAQTSTRAGNGPAGRVIIVPGIMGSQLGLPRPGNAPADLLWVDPADIIVGRLTELTLGARADVRPMGAVLYASLRLKLQLQIHGFDVALHDYDWRLGVDELGLQLAQRLHSEPHPQVSVVAHSMGGLVTRAALVQPGMHKVRRVVLLGTPNGGAFACVQALRGTYPVVRRLARLDAFHSAEQLADEVFSTFPGLCHMLPARRYTGRLDLFDARHWPPGPAPAPALLTQAAQVLRDLAPADARFALIIGVGQPTVTGLARHADGFLYTVTRHGDGTVPAACAMLAGARAWYVPVKHGELTRDPAVARAVADLLRQGATSRLRSGWSVRSRARAQVSDAQLRRTHAAKLDWSALSPQQRGAFLQNLSEPAPLTLRAPAPAHAPASAGRLRR